MHVLIAPDKFKGSLTSEQAADAIAQAVRDVLPSATTERVVVADGGEGVVDAVLAAGGRMRTTVVDGPLGDPVEATWATREGVAVIELARASGLQLITPTALTALQADTFGVGQLITAALDFGCSEVVVGVGGAASTDGGSGALRALGARILDQAGRDVPAGGDGLLRVARIDLAGLDRRLSATRIRLATDVGNPLLGPAGAAAVYAGQKGAGPAEIRRLEAALSMWAVALARATGVDVSAAPGAGAAGGFASAFLGATRATVESGFGMVSDLSDLPRRVARADLVIVGEGSLDAQSVNGKAPVAAAALARSLGVDVVAVAGRIAITPAQLRSVGIGHSVAMSSLAPSAAASMRDARTYLTEAASLVLRQWLSDQGAPLAGASSTWES